MNIRSAKENIRHTIEIYLDKNEEGSYLFPAIHQRPILLMGPPGIGKTAIVEQLSAECGIGLVSYNMTHHTRQSAVGLPHLTEREYEGRMMTVTEYTVSEIVASIYECIQDTGRREGILFIDEINCVSETLAPTMLQFLQKKMFGSFRIPDGWIIVAAGNPREFNRSARDYDIAVLDRLRRIDVEPDPEAWMEYARTEGVHGAVLTYLTWRQDHFFVLKPDRENPRYVTARGWQDLSELIYGYERRGLETGEDVIRQYLTVPEAAEGFADFYRLFRKYEKEYAFDAGMYRQLLALAGQADSRERQMVIGLLLQYLGEKAAEYAAKKDRLCLAEDRIQLLKKKLLSGEGKSSAADCLEAEICELERSLRVRLRYSLINDRDAGIERQCIRDLKTSLQIIREEHRYTPEAAAETLQELLEACEKEKEESGRSFSGTLETALRYVSEGFETAEQKEYLLGLSSNAIVVRFLSENPSDAYFRMSREML